MMVGTASIPRTCASFKLVPVASDGNCLFRALSVVTAGHQSAHQQIRQQIVEELESSKTEFEAFLTEDMSFVDYCNKMRRDGEWGGNLELLLASRIFKAKILVFQEGDLPSLQIQDPALNNNVELSLYLSYDAHHHYSPLLKQDSPLLKQEKGEPQQATTPAAPLSRLQEAMKVVQEATKCPDVVLLYNVVTSLDGDVVRSIKIIMAELKRRQEVKGNPKPVELTPTCSSNAEDEDEPDQVQQGKRRLRLSFPKLRLPYRYGGTAQRVN